VSDRDTPHRSIVADVDWASIVAQLPGFVMITSGPEHVVEFANAGLHELTRYRDVVGRRIADALPELVDQGFIAIRDEVYRTGIAYRATAQPFKLRPAPGEPLQDGHIDLIYQPIKRADGSVSGIIFAGYDVSDRKKAEEQARAMQFELMQMFRSSVLGAMAMILAHEVNQPLAVISNYATAARRLLGAGGATAHAEVEGALGEIEAAAHRASEIIRVVREMMGKGRPPDSKVDLAVAIRQAATLGLLDATRKNISYTTELAPDLFVAADPIQIQQVLLNLFRNAVEAAEDGGGGELEIVLSRVGAEAEIRVSDSGPGLAPQVRDRLFDPFVSTKEQGLGVGLSICRAIVERYGGRIWAEDRSGGGTVFCIRLPLLSRAVSTG
jgi:two-component system, LuxR family, sensor kinase FixL